MSNDRTQHKEILNKHGIKHDPLSIHGKDFAVRLRGYSQEEVDDFLDEVIRDYEQMVKIVLELTSSLDNQHTKELGRETRMFDMPTSKPVEPVDRGTISKDEMIMLKVRLANLERKVFGSSRSE